MQISSQAIGTADMSGLLSWRVKVGQPVKNGQPVADIGGGCLRSHTNGYIYRLAVPSGVFVTPDTVLYYLQSEMPMQDGAPQNKCTARSIQIHDSGWDWLCNYVDLDLSETNYTRAEVVRAMIEAFKSIAPEKRMKMLETNRIREIKGRYGSGLFPSKRSSRTRRGA
jgi:hypothetical protein